MDLTSQTLHQVQFHASLRGYNMTEVDTFLAEVALAVDELLARLRMLEAARGPVAATPTASRERNLASAGAPAQPSIRASAAPAHAAEEAARQLWEQAEARSEGILREAEATASAVREGARAAAEAALIQLEQLRARLDGEQPRHLVEHH